MLFGFSNNFKVDFNEYLIIGEVAQAHDGSLGAAHSYIDAVAKTGANAVKFQMHIADAESTPEEPWRVKFSTQDKTRYDYWKRMEFTEFQWKELKEHAHEVGLFFICSPFSIEAVKVLTRVDIDAWKIASGEINNISMLQEIVKTKKPILVSTGMSSFDEIDSIVAQLEKSSSQYLLMQCTSSYPCSAEKIGINILSEFSKKYKCPVGLSDHSGTIYPSLTAVMLGAKAVEVHVAFSHDQFGPDTQASLVFKDLERMVKGIQFITTMQKNPIDKDAQVKQLEPMRKLFMKSLVLKQSLKAGTVLKKEHFVFKKPGTGISPKKISEVLGCVLTRDMVANELLKEADFKRGEM